jgi:hypothetical protein
MDDDPVLVSLHEELERDDPRLAALLDGRAPLRQRPGAWLLVGLVLIAIASLLPPAKAFGLLAILAIVSSPLAVCWLVTSGDGSAPDRP